MMTNDSQHHQHLEELKGELAEREKELGLCIQEQEQLETRIAYLRQITVAMSRMLGEEFVPEDDIGLTDAIRQAFKMAAGNPMSAPEVREKLKQMGLDITQYGNVLNSVHTIIGRLLGREIKEAGTRGNTNQKVYVWNPQWKK